jgi:predicted transcriptional regulator
LGHSVPALDDVDMGKLFEDLGHVDLATRLYERALANGLPDAIHRQAVRRWSFIEKRQENLQAAIRLWQDAARDGQVYAHVELAKVYEHHTRNYQGALFWTQLALDHIAEPDCPPSERLRWEDALNHRLSRLKGKLARADTASGSDA